MVDSKYRAVIQDDNGDTTTGPAESYSEAAQRLKDALGSSDRNIGGDIKEVK